MNKLITFFQNRKSDNRGFVAFTASFILVFSLFYFSLILLENSFSAYDFAKRNEYRIQGNFNIKFCQNYAKLMISKDYYLSGYFSLSFGCSLFFIRNGNAVQVQASTTIGDIVFRDTKLYEIGNYEIK